MTEFSTKCIRDFKQFIGELTATSAGIHVALQFATSNLPENEIDPWEKIAEQFNVHLSGIDSERIFKSAARLNIVNVYSGFDLYLFSYRKEFTRLMKSEWKCKEGDSPFDEFKNNISIVKIKNKHIVLSEQIQLVQYYRLVRNAIVHPAEKTKQSCRKYYQDNNHNLNRIQTHYKMLSAPNSLDEINFHDVKLFARVLLDILPSFDEALDPGDELLKELLPVQSQTNLKASRSSNAAIGFLTNEFGISLDRAKRIMAH